MDSITSRIINKSHATVVEPGALTGFATMGMGLTSAERILSRHMRYLGAEVTSGPVYHRKPWLIQPSKTAQAGPGSLICDLTWDGGLADGLVDEYTVQAACGIMAVHGRRYGRPAALSVDYASATCGVLASLGVLAALLGRMRGRDITSVSTSVAQAALITVSQYLADETASEADPTDSFALVEKVTSPPFQSGDGVWFELETLESGPWIRFWRSLGAANKTISRGWRPFLLRYAKASAPLPAALARVLREHTFAEIRGFADTTGMAVCRVRTPEEREADPGLFCGGEVIAPWRISPLIEDVALRAQNPAPYSQPTGGGRLRLPLSGLRVVESTRRVQGPLASQLLRMLGAEVLRVEPPGGDPLRGMAPMAGDTSARFRALNRGKDVVEIDIKSVAGQNQLRELVGAADVFLHNWGPGKAAVLGLDSTDLSQVQPQLVYTYASGWGGDTEEYDIPGTDFMVQAYSGLSSFMGDDTCPVTSLMTLTDLLGGLVCAEGIVAGLLTRERQTRGQRVDTSLLSAATVLQYDTLEHHASSAQGCEAAPSCLPVRAWQTGSGWLTVSARTPTHTDRARRALKLPDTSRVADIEAELVNRCNVSTARELQQLFVAAGVPAQVISEHLIDVTKRIGASELLDRDECVFVSSPWRFS